jgi:hypothetical protein
MRQVLLLEEAADDLEAARKFYNDIEPGVGEYCVDSLLADIESLSFFHGIHRIVGACHRMLATRFPFGIYYREAEEMTLVIAVLDLRRDPAWVRKQVTRRLR